MKKSICKHRDFVGGVSQIHDPPFEQWRKHAVSMCELMILLVNLQSFVAHPQTNTKVMVSHGASRFFDTQPAHVSKGRYTVAAFLLAHASCVSVQPPTPSSYAPSLFSFSSTRLTLASLPSSLRLALLRLAPPRHLVPPGPVTTHILHRSSQGRRRGVIGAQRP